MQRKLIFSFSSCGGKNNPFLLWVYLKKKKIFFLVSLFSFSCLNFICRLLIPVAGFEQSSNTWFLSSASGKLWTPAYPTVVGGYHFLGVQPSSVLKSLLLEWNSWGWWLSIVSHLLKCPSKEVEGHSRSISEVEFAVPVTHTHVYIHMYAWSCGCQEEFLHSIYTVPKIVMEPSVSLCQVTQVVLFQCFIAKYIF